MDVFMNNIVITATGLNNFSSIGVDVNCGEKIGFAFWWEKAISEKWLNNPVPTVNNSKDCTVTPQTNPVFDERFKKLKCTPKHMLPFRGDSGTIAGTVMVWIHIRVCDNCMTQGRRKGQEASPLTLPTIQPSARKTSPGTRRSIKSCEDLISLPKAHPL